MKNYFVLTLDQIIHSHLVKIHITAFYENFRSIFHNSGPHKSLSVSNDFQKVYVHFSLMLCK